MDLLIRDGKIVTAKTTFKADIAVTNGKISAIGTKLKPERDTEIVDAKGKLILPGAIDGHTHLAMPFGGTISTDDYYAGTRAAACGGTTTVFDFALQGQGEKMDDTVKRRDALASVDAAIDYSFHIGVCDATTDEMIDSMEDAVAMGITSFKVFMVYDFGVDDGSFYKVLQKSTKIGALVGVHAENNDVNKVLVKQYLDEGKVEPWWHYMSKNEEVEAGLVMESSTSNVVYYKNRTMDSDRSSFIDELLKEANSKKFLRKNAIDVTEYNKSIDITYTSREVILEKENISGFFITMVYLFLIYFLILFNGSIAATSVAKEKSNRTMELLITNATSNKLIAGKVIGVGLAGLTNLVIFLSAGIMGYMLNKQFYPPILTQISNTSLSNILVLLYFLLVGYFLYLTLFAALGALVSKVEELNQTITPVTLITILAFIATSNSIAFPDSTFFKVLGYIPFVSPFSGPARILLSSEITSIEIILYMSILLASALIMGYIASKIYRYGTLNYGNAINFKKLFSRKKKSGLKVRR